MKSSTKSLALLTASLLTFGSAVADIHDEINQVYDFNRDGIISLSNINGDVEVTGCDCNQVTLRAEIIASDQAVRDRISVEIDASDNRLSIETRYAKTGLKWGNNNGHSKVNYFLSVPNTVSLKGFSLVNGDLDIKEVTGKLKANLVNGELSTDGLSSDVQAESVIGDISIVMNNLTHVEDIRLNSVNGGISLTLPSNADATVKANTVNGRLSNDFDIDVKKHKYVGSSMTGTLGSGRVSIDLETVNGRVIVNR